MRILPGIVAFLLSGCSFLGDTPEVRSQKERFPGLSSETAQDLVALKSLVLADLSDPASCKLANGLPDNRRFIGRIRLACGWRDPAFVSPLLKLLDSSEQFRYWVAACLLRYDRPDLDRAIEKYSDWVYVHHLSGDVVESMTIGDLSSKYHATKKLAEFIRPAEIDESVSSLQHGPLGERIDAWLRLAYHGWIPPWKEFSLDEREIGRAAEFTQSPWTLEVALVGNDRMARMLKDLREYAQTPAEKQTLTWDCWLLGCDDEAAACRIIVADTLKRLCDEVDPRNEACIQIYPISVRPNPRDLDLYVLLTQCRSRKLRSLGWKAIVKCDIEDSFKLLRGRVKEPDGLEEYCVSDILQVVCEIAAKANGTEIPNA